MFYKAWPNITKTSSSTCSVLFRYDVILVPRVRDSFGLILVPRAAILLASATDREGQDNAQAQ